MPLTKPASVLFQQISIFISAGLAGAAVIYAVLCLLGLAPWLTVALQFGDTVFPSAGIAVQLTVTFLLIVMGAFLPPQARILALERSHRQFQISMDDVARAYHLCHTADRAGIFTASAEFDQVRERLAYLRDHPDLARLEPEVLEVAAQMSQQARRLADVYSDANVARAKAFLRQRQKEADDQQARIVEAMQICQDIAHWTKQVEREEQIVVDQLALLDQRLQATLPLLGYALEQDDLPHVPDNVVSLPQKARVDMTPAID